MLPITKSDSSRASRCSAHDVCGAGVPDGGELTVLARRLGRFCAFYLHGRASRDGTGHLLAPLLSRSLRATRPTGLQVASRSRTVRGTLQVLLRTRGGHRGGTTSDTTLNEDERGRSHR